jgi:hypothetical protein
MQYPTSQSFGADDPASSSSKVAVPSQTRDPVGSLCPWPTTFRIKGRQFDIPAHSAAEWLAVLMAEDCAIEDVFLEFVPDGATLLLDAGLGFELDDVAKEIITTVSGRPWYVSLRLIQVMRGSWNILGATMLLRGVDATRMSLSGWLDVALLLLFQHLDPKDVAMVTAQLEMPPTGEEVPAEEMEMSREEFLSLMG